ncbi:hypothetical protein DLJ59_01100 [Micromonospora inaquosa]|uniref:DUF4192 domain-containing protein n=1 Tax=Micromonospora inaquosa TaxID=2203716 RepID=A0A3N9X7U1_9ACTN|nr:hypothetical protein DLJ59_01100 [Micromonospora inaquosa]
MGCSCGPIRSSGVSAPHRGPALIKGFGSSPTAVSVARPASPMGWRCRRCGSRSAGSSPSATASSSTARRSLVLTVLSRCWPRRGCSSRSAPAKPSPSRRIGRSVRRTNGPGGPHRRSGWSASAAGRPPARGRPGGVRRGSRRRSGGGSAATGAPSPTVPGGRCERTSTSSPTSAAPLTRLSRRAPLSGSSPVSGDARSCSRAASPAVVRAAIAGLVFYPYSIKEFVVSHVPTFTVRSQAELLGLVPYLLGYHPEQSLVALFLKADRRVAVAARVDLAAPMAQVVEAFRDVADRTAAQTLVLVGYGNRDVAPTVTAAGDALAVHLTVSQTLLVITDRYFCLDCPCDATEGVSFDAKATATAAQSTVEGLVALPSRDALLALTDPDPAQQAAVATAIAALQPTSDEPAALRALLNRARNGHRLTVEQAARTAILLTDQHNRDTVRRATSGAMWERDLWLDLTRRVPGEYVTAPAGLAAWCAWQLGDETLALAAARRALTVDPQDRISRIVALAAGRHIPARDLAFLGACDFDAARAE